MSYMFEGCSQITDVYFQGSEAQWNSIIIGVGNEALINAKKHFNFGSSFGENTNIAEVIHYNSTREVFVEFTKSWFSQEGTNKEYNHDLAKFCAAFSMM